MFILCQFCLRMVVDSKILCLFTLVFKVCNVCNFSKNDRFTPCVFYQHSFIFHDLPKTNARYFSIHWPFYSLLLVYIYSVSQYLCDQPPFVENTLFMSVTFYSCDCELLADNYVAFK